MCAGLVGACGAALQGRRPFVSGLRVRFSGGQAAVLRTLAGCQQHLSTSLRHLSPLPAPPTCAGGGLHAVGAAYPGSVPLPPHPAPRHQTGWVGKRHCCMRKLGCVYWPSATPAASCTAGGWVGGWVPITCRWWGQFTPAIDRMVKSQVPHMLQLGMSYCHVTAPVVRPHTRHHACARGRTGAHR